MKASEEQNLKRRKRYAELMADPEQRDKIQKRLKKYRSENLEKCNELDRRWRNNHREQYRAQKRRWSSLNREKDLASHRASYLKHKEKRKIAHKAYYDANRDKVLNKEKRRREKNPDEGKLRSSRHYFANKLRYKLKYLKRVALQKAATVNLVAIESFLRSTMERKYFTCYYCTRTFPISNLHWDHIIALSKGGAHSVENLCTACSNCNLKKGAKSLSEWNRIGQQVLPI